MLAEIELWLTLQLFLVTTGEHIHNDEICASYLQQVQDLQRKCNDANQIK